MTAKQIFLSLTWILLLSFPIAAQMTENLTEEEQQQRQENQAATHDFLVQRLAESVFEKDINTSILTLLAKGISGDKQFDDSIREEFGITNEQATRLLEQEQSALHVRSEEFQKIEETLKKNFEPRALNGDIYLTEEEDEMVDMAMDYVFEQIEFTAAGVFTDEQREKADGMILALSGGLESPFFSERHMAAIDMNDEQKKKFAAINKELKPERDKMIDEFLNVVRGEGVSASFKDFIKKFTNALSTFKSYGREIKKRRSEILTSVQIAKAMKLSKLPKALSIFHLLSKTNWTPNADSWKPGDPLPEGLVPNNPQPAPRFPIGEQDQE